MFKGPEKKNGIQRPLRRPVPRPEAFMIRDRIRLRMAVEKVSVGMANPPQGLAVETARCDVKMTDR
jgi:hypothetical protein